MMLRAASPAQQTISQMTAFLRLVPTPSAYRTRVLKEAPLSTKLSTKGNERVVKG